MIIPSERLESNPKEIIQNVLQFLNPNSNNNNISQLNISNSSVKSMVDKYFPKFENSTGWKAHSEYEPMPELLKQELYNFYEPYNKKLFELLKIDKYKEWILS
jgi:hypothetical protein